jgi:hypothetical protein
MHQSNNIVCSACKVLLTHATNIQDVEENNKNFQRIRQKSFKTILRKMLKAHTSSLPPSCLVLPSSQK